MTDADALILSQELADLATLVAHMMNDLTLTLQPADISNLQNYSNQLTNASRKIAIAGALAALQAAQADFNAMTQATTAANAAVTQLKSNAAKLNAILNVLGAAVTFGNALTGGVLGTVMTAASALATAAAGAMA